MSYIVSSLFVCIGSYLVSIRVFPHNVLNAIALFLSVVLFQITLITLVLGVTNLLEPSFLIIGSFISATLFYFCRYFLESYSLDSVRASPQTLPLKSRGMMIVLIMPVIFLMIFYPLIGSLFQQIRLVHPLSWDVVSYHLPNVIGYLQSKSLWTFSNSFSQYPGGNELLNLWSFVPLNLDSMLGVTNLSLNLGILLMSVLILRDLKQWQYSFNLISTIFFYFLVYFGIEDLQILFFDLGRNDVTIAFWLLVGLWTWLNFTEVKQKRSQQFWLLWSGISFGCALGTKPNAIYYIIGIVFIYFHQTYRDSTDKKVFTKIICFWLIPIAVISSFWYLRNLFILGSFFEKHIVQDGVKLSILRHLLDREIYTAPNGIILVLLMSLLVSFLSLINLKPQLFNNKSVLLLGFYIVSLLAWVMTPHSAGYYAGNESYLHPQLRYAVVSIVTAVILCLYLLSELASRFPHAQSNTISQLLQTLHQLEPQNHRVASLSTPLPLLAVLLIVLTLLSSQTLAYTPPVGLPGYAGILFTGSNYQSKVYEWVQKNIRSQHIYSLGLRPYGLVNFPFSNKVTDGGSPASWQHQSIDLMPYDYMAVSVDPFTGQVSEELAHFLRQPPGYHVVFHDQLTAVLARHTE